ncbi:hypothetical protein [Schleiferilactobacillus perolens]|uniref:Uncharacterized protein n=1 Tax=Schleiferilactobacillus perolens DSM 12744 TaxID=1423792 RepID=A0A0R1MIU3_9LACO|nr:hypothetical protein [Schleiferilactobacillus perolens]KRL07884.1 hypothetical protein FD09_GL002026 [Schleiferilactobacillus perolens DSM 12744]
MANEYKYDGTAADEHRAVAGTELIKLVGQARGITVRTIDDLLAANTSVKGRIGKKL